MDKLAAATGFWAATPSVSFDEYEVPSRLAETFHAPQQAPRLLVLSEALPTPQLGLLDFPTVGSAGHYIGSCKPCAFFYTKGCGNGTECDFCHLCPPDEKRRRQKEKQAAIREVRRQRRQVRV